MLPKKWRAIRNKILKRDNNICFRCDKKFKRKRDLSVHHIVPRREGGSENEGNLITLCHKCHDFVEIKGFRSKAQIIGSYEIKELKNILVIDNKKIKKDKKDGKEESFERPEWHKYVYGGQKK